MRAIQITVDEALLSRLDATDLVKERGRSAVLRQAATEFLHRYERTLIAQRYAEGYARSPSIDEELGDWHKQAAWPES